MKWQRVGKTMQAEHPADRAVMAQVHEERRDGEPVYRWRVFRKGDGKARELLNEGERFGEQAAMDDAEISMNRRVNDAAGRTRGFRW